MKVKSAYEDVLSIILDEADLKLKEVKVEQVILKSGHHKKSGQDFDELLKAEAPAACCGG